MKIFRKTRVSDASTQTLQGLWLPQMPMYFDDSSESEMSILEVRLKDKPCVFINDYRGSEVEE